MNELRYYGEYSFHMYGWFLIGWAYDKNYGIISKWASSAKDAKVNNDELDGRPIIDILSYVLGILGV